MVQKCFFSLLILTLSLSTMLCAEEVDVQSNVSYKVNKMQKVLNLTDSQVDAITPIVKDYLAKRMDILQQVQGQGIIDHVAVKTTLKGLKDDEYNKLSKILSPDQMKKWIDKENLLAVFNPDTAESVNDDGPTLSANGANFKF